MRQGGDPRLPLELALIKVTRPGADLDRETLAYRLEQKGLKIHYNAAAITRHYHPMNVDSFTQRQYTVGKSGAIFYRKHPELAHFPDDELSTYTAAAVILAADALVGATPAAKLFTEHQPLPSIVLDGDDLDLEGSRD